MEKHIVKWSYWLGIVCVAIAVAWRGVNSLGWFFPNAIVGQGIWYMTFYKAALLFLLTAVATANYAWFKGLKP